MLELKGPHVRKKRWIPGPRNRSWVVTIVSVLLLCLMIAWQIPSFFFKNSYKDDVLLAESIFAKWKASPEKIELFESLHDLLQKRPKLQRRYEGLIAQVIIQSRQSKILEPISKMGFQQLQEDTSLYVLYGEASMLIHQKSLSQALEISKRLEKSISIDLDELGENQGLSTINLLYGFNLIRIALLQKDLGRAQDELQTWQNVESFLHWGKNQLSHGQASLTEIIIDNFRDKQVYLPDFIRARKQALSR